MLQFVHVNVSSFCKANVHDEMYTLSMCTLLGDLSAQNNDIQSQITITKNFWTELQNLHTHN
jgi:hypothetical protein